MTSHSGLLLRCLAALGMICTPTLANALEGDRIRPYAGINYTYQDNVFYLDDRVDANSVSFLKGGQKGDQTFGLKVGLDMDWYYSRQTFSLRSQITNNRHVTYDNLNYNAYNLRGAWNWVLGERWDGDAGVEKNQVASTFYDFRTADRSERNLRTLDALFASAMLRMSPDWKLRGAIRYTQTDNSISRFQLFNRNELTLEAGSRHYSKGTDDFIGINFRVVDGKLPNRETIAASATTNAYRQYTAEGVVEYQAGGSTRLIGNLGLTTRRYDDFSQRNFSGVTGRVSGTYSLSGKTSVNGALFREIGAWEDNTTNYIVTQGFSVGATQSLTEKVNLQANYQNRMRTFDGDPGVVTGLPNRSDRLQSLSLSAVWLPTRNVRLDATVSRDTRSADGAWQANGFGPFNDFKVLTFSVGGQLTF
jgi:exopolysaccharide biosynthesis operon protein EpsL